MKVAFLQAELQSDGQLPAPPQTPRDVALCGRHHVLQDHRERRLPRPVDVEPSEIKGGRVSCPKSVELVFGWRSRAKPGGEGKKR